jgi:GDP/UDP-N,N'-diacetylbacillosamine 2-epimerase (hydrolysing)
LSKRRVCYVTGTRADFGLMARTLRLIHASPLMELGIAVTGMHLSAKYGLTVREVEAERLPIVARIPTPVDETSGAAMARASAETVLGLVQAFSAWPPQLLLLLGDRGEMLAGAVAATYLGVPIAHVHGGERSGTVDEPVRHAISKLSHFHLVATAASRERLIRMGEAAERVSVTGAPGLDELRDARAEPREALCRRIGLDAARPVCLTIFHPVVQEAGQAGEQARAVVQGILAAGAQVLALAPNADAGGDAIRAAFDGFASRPDFRLATHLPRAEYLSWLARADAMAGNSSSGIIEAASLGLWVVNVGKRQQLRERSPNVIDVAPVAEEVRRAVSMVLARPRGRWQNVYGDGGAAERIVEILGRVPLEPAVLEKINAY